MTKHSIGSVSRIVSVLQQESVNANEALEGVPDVDDLCECMNWLVLVEERARTAVQELRGLLETIAKKNE